MRTTYFALTLSFFLLGSLFSSVGHARWAEAGDAPHAVNFDRSSFKIRKDGTYSVLVERQVEILKEQARLDQGLTRISYDARSSDIQIIEAKTINKGKVVRVKKSDIEIKPLASSGPGFDVVNQVTIAFPEVAIGSKLYVKYKKTVRSPLVPGLFTIHFPIGWNEWLQAFEMNFDSEVPLYTEVFQADGQLEVKNEGRRASIRLRAPFFRMIVEEENDLMDSESLIWIGVTTAKEWSDLPRSTVMAYEDQMSAELPKSLAAIAEKAKGLNNPVDQINSVTSGLADAVRYVGDWRTVKGAYHPRALSVIAESGYGDCKDFTVATGAMLKRLGYEVRAAWVARGKNWVVSPLKLAAPDMNHAILFARKDGRDFWIDPTNSTSFAQAIYADIANRPAVVLHPEGPKAMQIPAMLPEDGEIQTTLNLDFGDRTSEVVKAQGKISLTGRGILSMTGQELNYAKQNLDYMLIGWITTATNLKSWQVGAYDLKSRTVKDLHTSFEFTEMWRPLVTSAGRGYSMPASPFVNFFRFRREQRISGVRFDDPIRYRKTYQFRGGQPVVAKAIECRGQSRWATYSRSMKRESSHVLLDDAIELKVPSISAKEIQSDEFAKFQAEFLGCMHDAVIVFKDDQTSQKRP